MRGHGRNRFGSNSSCHGQRTNHGGWNQSALSPRLSTSSSTPAILRLSRRRPGPVSSYVLPPKLSLTYHPHPTAPHNIYSFYNRPPSTNDHPPPSAPPPSSPRNEPQSPFSQDPSPPSHTPQAEPPIDDEPLYVNAKQYYRILKRRVARARLEEVHRLSQKRKVRTHCHSRISLHSPANSCSRRNSHIFMNRAINMPCVAREDLVAASSLQRR